MHALLLSARRSPLTLFIFIGLALFAVDRWIQNSADASLDDPYTIRVSNAQQLALQQAFHAEHGRPPNADELNAKLAFWLDEQMLYRGAMALNLDQSDTIVRRQLALKMRILLAQRNSTPTPSDAELKAWLDTQAQRYGTPANIDFEQVFLSRGKHGHGLLNAAKSTQIALQNQPSQWQTLSDPLVSGLSMKQANFDSLRRALGQDFAKAVLAITDQGWQGPIASSFGLHFVRITGRTGFQPARLDDIRAQVLADYLRDQEQLATAAALNDLKARYRIHFDTAES